MRRLSRATYFRPDRTVEAEAHFRRSDGDANTWPSSVQCREEGLQQRRRIARRELSESLQLIFIVVSASQIGQAPEYNEWHVIGVSNMGDRGALHI